MNVYSEVLYQLDIRFITKLKAAIKLSRTLEITFIRKWLLFFYIL